MRHRERILFTDRGACHASEVVGDEATQEVVNNHPDDHRLAMDVSEGKSVGTAYVERSRSLLEFEGILHISFFETPNGLDFRSPPLRVSGVFIDT